jgi:hypothetical protein
MRASARKHSDPSAHRRTPKRKQTRRTTTPPPPPPSTPPNPNIYYEAGWTEAYDSDTLDQKLADEYGIDMIAPNRRRSKT